MTCLQTLQVKPATVHSSTCWHQDLYHVLIYLFFFLWGGGKGVRGFSIIRVSHPLSDLIAVGHFFGLGSLQQPVESNFPPPFTAGLLASRSSGKLKGREEQKQKHAKRETERNAQEQKLQQTAAGTTLGPCRSGKLFWTHKFCMDRC